MRRIAPGPRMGPSPSNETLDVVVKRHIPGIDRRGRTVTVTDRTHVFTWLERRRGDWIVTNTAQWNPDLVVTVEGGWSSGDAADQPGMPPAWMDGGYSQEPLPGS